MKRKGEHMLKERNPVVRDTIRNLTGLIKFMVTNLEML